MAGLEIVGSGVGLHGRIGTHHLIAEAAQLGEIIAIVRQVAGLADGGGD